MRECAGGPLGALGARLRLPRLRCPPPRVQRPPRGGAWPLSLRPASVRPWAGGGGGEGGVLWYPNAAPRRPRGGGLLFLALGGQPPTGGAHSSPAFLYPLRAGPPCRPSLGPHAPLAVAARCRLAGEGATGRRSAVGGLRGSGPPLALVGPVLPPTGGGARPSVALYLRGGVGRGAWLPGGGASRGTVPPYPIASIAWAVGAWPSPASSLVWWLGLWWWRIPPAVAPVAEGVAQGPGEPVVGVCIRDAEHRPPLQEGRPHRLSVGPRCPNQCPEDPLVVLRGRPPPGGYLPVHRGFYGVQKSQNQLQSEILLFLSNCTIKSIFSGVSPPPPPSKLEIFQPLDRQCSLDSN